jgi:GNAT superfamily N-acetyltransferase
MRPATRVAVAADAPALTALVNSAYRGDSSRAGWATEADLIGGQRIDTDRMIETIATPDHVVLVHEREGDLVACVLLERTGDNCYLGMLTVRPTLQADGLGRGMLSAAEQWAVEHWSSRVMQMTVITLRAALIAWYERRGYTRTGEHRPFPYDDVRFGLPRRDDLVFEVLQKTLSR